MPLTNSGTYEPRTEEEIRQALFTVLEAELDDPDLTEGSILRALVDAQAKTAANQQEKALQSVLQSAYIETAEGEHLERVVAIKGVTRNPASHATGVVTFSSDTAVSQDYTIQKGTVVMTEGNDPIRFETTESVTLANGTTSVDATARAVSGGQEGNLGANALTVMPSPPSGVDSVTNTNPTGDPSFTETDGDAQTVGTEREGDEELRERAQQFITRDGAATVDALLASITSRATPESLTLKVNDTASTDAQNRPAKSFEAIVYGESSQQDVIDSIFETKAALDQPVGGYEGTKVTGTWESSINGQTFSGAYSNPTNVNITLSMDIVTESDYIGDTELKDEIIKYIGGTLSNGDSALGTGVTEDVYISEIIDVVTGEDTGVRGIADGSITTTPSATTDANGLRVVAIGSGEVARTTPSDITLN